jgi:hypothetical protein
MRVDKGEKDGVKLDGLSFIVLMHSPKAMAEGNITVGLIVDERASEKQVQAITEIATGAAGGPMAALGPIAFVKPSVDHRQDELRWITRAVIDRVLPDLVRLVVVRP